MKNIMEIAFGIKDISQTLIPDTAMQFWNGHRTEQYAVDLRLRDVRNNAMRQVVGVQRVNPLLAFADELVFGVAPQQWHAAIVRNAILYDSYLADVKRQIDSIQRDGIEQLQQCFTFDESNFKTACDLAIEAGQMEAKQAAEVKRWAHDFHIQAVEDIEQQCSLLWQDCYKRIPWEQRFRRWNRRIR